MNHYQEHSEHNIISTSFTGKPGNQLTNIAYEGKVRHMKSSLEKGRG